MEWTCHICGHIRPDSFINVLTRDVSSHYGFAVGTAKENIRYCNDRPLCIEGAKDFTFIDREGDDIEA